METPNIKRCPRCRGNVLRSWDELFCLSCGTLWEPVRARDRVVETDNRSEGQLLRFAKERAKEGLLR